jgi:hypothetical protein
MAPLQLIVGGEFEFEQELQMVNAPKRIIKNVTKEVMTLLSFKKQELSFEKFQVSNNNQTGPGHILFVRICYPIPYNSQKSERLVNPKVLSIKSVTDFGFFGKIG